MLKNSNLSAEVWSQPSCPACSEAKRLLERYGIKYAERLIGINGYTKKDLIDRVPEARSVPQIFLGNEYVGGLHELKKKLAEYDNN